MKLRKGITIIFSIGLLSLLLSGCGSINSWLAERTADTMPHWMGGLPDGVPPRPDDPRYQSYIEGQKTRNASLANGESK